MIHLIIESASGQQFPVISLFGNPAVFHHQNQISIADCRKPVSNHKTGLIRHKTAHGLLYLHFRPCIHIGGRLVQYQHMGIGKHSPCNGQELSLSLGNMDAIVAEHGFKPLRKLFNIRINHGGLCCLLYLFPCNILSSISQIFVDGSVKQPCIL